ncbi:hypothetical protein GCM10025868_22030 [Angustibacter aerolatus]|uniref:FAS1 domain-containing protein n=1 Tax=Angustibacter aerolatus TaxID=1162965 RepID=A0ABQ6JFJ7_9ACTN|nr:hypothetical protein GCM10025868_22030 [Angustibacter aerolatus]
MRDLTGTSYRSEADVFAAAATLGIDTIENVLLYHVVPGATITSKQAVRSNGARSRPRCPTPASPSRCAAGASRSSRLVDADTDDANPYLVPGQARHQQGQPADRARHQPGAAPGRPLRRRSRAAVPSRRPRPVTGSSGSIVATAVALTTVVATVLSGRMSGESARVSDRR